MTQWERRRERRRVPPFFWGGHGKAIHLWMPLVTIERTREPRGALKLLPHQRRLLANRLADGAAFPVYVYWGMGSGKTIGGCLCMQCLRAPARVLVLCDKSTVEQWMNEVSRVCFGEGMSEKYVGIQVFVEHFESLDHAKGPRPDAFDMVIVDEAHRFRNAWSKESARMLSWVARIHACPRVVLMSGTPIVHDADELAAFLNLMRASNIEDVRGRVSFYDPRATATVRQYASVDDRIVECPMTWAQTFESLLHRRQTFAIHLEDEKAPRVRTTSTRNTYNTKLRSIVNCPFRESPELSPKMVRMVQAMGAEEADGIRQVIYSSRRDTGVVALRELWAKTTKHPKHVCAIDGSMTTEERAAQIVRFNKAVHPTTLFITDAAAQGIDLKRVGAVHVMEPSDNVQDERQVINRAVRYRAHAGRAATVRVYRYVCVFPADGRVAPPWKATLYASGMFAKEELAGITRRVQYALLALIADEEEHETIDQRTLRTRARREREIQTVLEQIQAVANEG